jgi:hypothetical protein
MTSGGESSCASKINLASRIRSSPLSVADKAIPQARHFLKRLDDLVDSARIGH